MTRIGHHCVQRPASCNSEISIRSGRVLCLTSREVGVVRLQHYASCPSLTSNYIENSRRAFCPLFRRTERKSGASARNHSLASQMSLEAAAQNPPASSWIFKRAVGKQKATASSRCTMGATEDVPIPGTFVRQRSTRPRRTTRCRRFCGGERALCEASGKVR